MDVSNTKKFNHLSLCTGYGGIDLGLERVLPSLRAIAFCEIEKYAIENLIHKMEQEQLTPAPIWTNLKTFPFKQFLGHVDILSGGFPCQPFSTGGYTRADTDPRHLFPYIKQGIIECRPAFVFLENVPGIITSTLQGTDWNDPQGTPVLLHVCRELERIGYQVKIGIFSAREIGLPHTRKRVFILGKRFDIKKEKLKEFFKLFRQPIKNDGNSQWKLSNLIHKIKKDDRKKSPINSGKKYVLQKVSLRTRASLDYNKSIAIPVGRDRKQFFFEPPRTIFRNSKIDARRNRSNQTTTTTDNTSRYDHVTDQEISNLQREYQSEMGRNVDGVTNRMDYEELKVDFSSIEEELALLGNGVIPDVAEKAFRHLFNLLLND
jgi:DNA-cytosine methyltransferase